VDKIKRWIEAVGRVMEDEHWISVTQPPEMHGAMMIWYPDGDGLARVYGNLGKTIPCSAEDVRDIILLAPAVAEAIKKLDNLGVEGG